MIINKTSKQVINSLKNSKITSKVVNEKKIKKPINHLSIKKDMKSRHNIFVYSNKTNFKYHLTELKDRVNICGISFFLSLVSCLFYSKEIIKIIQLIGLKKNVSFLQISPGDFFFTSIDVFLYIKDRTVFWDIMRNTINIISNNIICYSRAYYS